MDATTRASDTVKQMLAEMLSSLATPDVAERIIHDAVRRASLANVPTEGTELSRFVSGPLYECIERSLGQDAADALSGDLLPLLRALCVPVDDLDDSHVRLTLRPNVLPGTVRPPRDNLSPMASPRPLARSDSASRFDALDSIPAPRGATPASGHALASGSARSDGPGAMRVVLASRSVMREFEIAGALGAHGNVTRVDDVFDLVDQASGDGAGRVFVVLDARNGTVQPTTLAAATTELPEGTVVVLWGTPDVESDALGAIAPEAMVWTRLSSATSPRDLARYLLTVVP